MAFLQRIRPACQDTPGGCPLPDCILIDLVTTDPVTHHETGEVIHEAGAVVGWSHFPAAIHPEHRLNDTHPAEDHRGAVAVPVTVTPLCEACRAHPAAAGHFGLPVTASP